MRTECNRIDIGKIGRNACEEAQMIMRPNVSLHEILSSVVGFRVESNAIGLDCLRFTAFAI